MSAQSKLADETSLDIDLDMTPYADRINISPTIETGAAANDNDNKKTKKKKKPSIWVRLRMSRRRRYFYAAVINLLLIWAAAISFVTFTPDRYFSKFTLLIPGAGAGSSVNLDNLGQATTSVNSAYASSKVDPKTNYKAIAMSPVVLDRAAKAMGITLESFGQPKIKLIDQTTLIEVTITASEGKIAKEKSTHFHAALEATLSDLRAQELKTRRLANERVLSEYRENVDQAQLDVLEFQQDSTIVSSDQFKNLVLNTESLKQRRAEASVELEAIKANLDVLRKALEISAEQAAAAIKLQNDTVFGSLVAKVADANTVLVENRAVWGNNHPKVVHAQARLGSARGALLNRAADLTGIATYDELDNLYITGDSARSQLFQQVISLSAKQSAAASQIESFSAQITNLESRLNENASLAAQLQDLERTHQVATAIYVSAAAKTDLGNSDVYASYPMTQILMPPTLPKGAEKFTKPAAIAGAAIGSILICLALLLSWKRSVLLQKLQKKS